VRHHGLVLKLNFSHSYNVVYNHAVTWSQLVHNHAVTWSQLMHAVTWSQQL